MFSFAKVDLVIKFFKYLLLFFSLFKDNANGFLQPHKEI